VNESFDVPLPAVAEISTEEKVALLRVLFECIIGQLEPAALRVLRAECINHPRHADATEKIVAAIDQRLSRITRSQLP
jgi:hypothetical protein